MATPPSTVSGAEADSSALHTYYCLRSKLEESKQNLRDLKERYLTARATAFFLANHLQKHGESPSAVATQLTNGGLSSSGKGSPLHSSLPSPSSEGIFSDFFLDSRCVYSILNMQKLRKLKHKGLSLQGRGRESLYRPFFSWECMSASMNTWRAWPLKCVRIRIKLLLNIHLQSASPDQKEALVPFLPYGSIGKPVPH